MPANRGKSSSDMHVSPLRVLFPADRGKSSSDMNDVCMPGFWNATDHSPAHLRCKEGWKTNQASFLSWLALRMHTQTLKKCDALSCHV